MLEVLITGANRGIGLALAQQHVARGDRVLAVVRESSSQLDALDLQIEAPVELTDADAVQALATRLQARRFDRLVLNAGILHSERLEDFGANSAAQVLAQFTVNALAPLQLVAALRGTLASDAKIGLITSRMGSMQDNSSGGYYGYRMSKAALNAAGRSLAMDLRDAGVAVALLHPGFVRTEMTGGQGDRTPDEAAAGLIERLDQLDLAHSGCFWHANGSDLPW
jgi:NAD(P)-dependent dehydrogenase (short-subunit alcohol dehydrogenase family)